MKKFNTKDISIIGILVALIVVLALTPLGIVPLGVISATTVHIPVIVGAIILGPKVGGILGLFFGLVSFAKAFLTPNLSSVAFVNPIVSVLPRIMIGIFSYYAYRGFLALFNKKSKDSGNDNYKNLEDDENIINGPKKLAIALASAIGSLTNTALVMTLIYFLYGEVFVTSMGRAGESIAKVIFSLACINGIPEMFLAILISTPICVALFKLRKK